MTTRQLRNICATIWNEDELQKFKGLCPKYWIVGKEICPTTQKPHFQCYGEIGKQVSFGKIKKLLPTSHFEPRKGTQKEAIDYCKKDNSYEEHGTASKPGARTDIALTKEMAQSGHSVKDIIDKLENPNYQAIRTAEKLVEYLKPQRHQPPTVKWYYGHSGTGKTKAAIEEAKNTPYWLSADTLQWWDGYDGETYVIIDDFRADFCKFHTLLRYLDRYPVRVPVKGGYRPLMATTIVITSPYPPNIVYDKCEEEIQQLLRRIHVIKLFQ